MDSTDSPSPRKGPNTSNKVKISQQAPRCTLRIRNTHIYEVCLVTGMQIMDNRSLVQVRKFCHVIRFVELGRIDLIDLVFIYLPLL